MICRPIQSYWLPAQYPNRKCIDIAALYYTTGILNVVSDFLIFLWPARDLAQIKISLKQRVTLITMFTLGILICVAGICRLWYTSVYITEYDALWNGSTLYVIVAIETSTGIVCGCLPACKPLMTKIAPRIFKSTHSSARPSTHKKASKMDGQSFPFQTLSGGGIVKVMSVDVDYHDAESRAQSSIASVAIKRVSSDEDATSAASQEILFEHNSKKALDH